jgi:hypothetical protein
MEIGFTPLFTGGSGRSGTTIILNLLKDHPQVHSSLPREIKYLTSRFGLIDLNFGRPLSLEEDFKSRRNNLAATVLNLTGRKKEQFFVKYLRTTWWSEMGKKGQARGLIQGITYGQLQSAIVRFQSDFKRNKLQASRVFYQQLSLAQIKKDAITYFADSTPVNMMQANYLRKLFPNAKFINMIRDGRDVALSVAKEKWGPNDPYKALSWWANRVLASHRALLEVEIQDKIDMRLEDLIVNKRNSEYARLLYFLKINDAVQCKTYFEQSMLPEKMSQGLWQQEVKNPNLFNAKYDKLLLKLKSEGVIIEKFY